MASFLVMKSSIKRLFSRKSTYVMIVVIPVLISIAGLFLTVSGSNTINIGVAGDQKLYDYVQEELLQYPNVVLHKADDRTINSDYIMGKYSYIVVKDDINNIKNIFSDLEVKEVRQSELTEKMLSMLLVAYTTVVTFFSSSIIRDRKNGIIKRYCYSGQRSSSYIMGNLAAVIVVSGVQILAVMLLWVLLISGFELEILRFILVWLMLTSSTVVLGFAATVVSKSEMMAGILASSVAVIIAIIGGAFVPYDEMPDIIQNISVISPVRWLFLFV